jgi:hypothetical protein
MFAVLFQCHERHQYPISGQGRCYYAYKAARAASLMHPHHFESCNHILRSLTVNHLENTREFVRFLFYVFSMYIYIYTLRSDTYTYVYVHVYERNPCV